MIELAVGLMSLFLGVFAIWLSIKLYRMSESGARRMGESQVAIQKSVEQLDRIFGQMYSDTWSLVRDSYERMHERLWTETRSRTVGAAPPPGQPSPRTGASDDLPDHHPSQKTPYEGASPGGQLAVGGAILAVFQRLSRTMPVVRAGDLADAVTREGYPAVVVLNALYDMTIVQRRLLLADERFVPESIVAETPDELRRAEQPMKGTRRAAPSGEATPTKASGT